MRLQSGLILGAAAMLGLAVVTAQPEFLLPGVALAGGSAYVRRNARQKELANSLAEMEKRLQVTEGELESTTGELEQLRVEREFDRQLLHAPKNPEKP